MPEPLQEYQARLGARQQEAARREKLHLRMGYAKLGVLIAGIVLLWLVVKDRTRSPWWLVAAVVSYAALAVAHEWVIRSRTRAERAAAFYSKGIARIEDRWAGTGETGERFHDPQHIYADDLDLFGAGSLFELVSSARTPMGEECLANWLKAGSRVAEIRERHQVIEELRNNLGLRESVALAGEELRARLDPQALGRWAAEGAGMGGTALGNAALRVFAALCAVAASACGVLLMVRGALWLLAIVLVIETAVMMRLYSPSARVIEGISANAEGLALFAAILQRIEEEPFTSSRLQQFAEELRGGPLAASAAVGKLARIVYWTDSRDNLIVRLADLPLLYTVQMAMIVDAWRGRWGARVERWIAIAGEMEALLSLAAYSYEHPGDCFPEIREGAAGEIHLAGEELGHPLIAAARCVRNSVALDTQARVLLVSGSNMSGKSTWLRTVGVNAVLAMCGAPVRARSLRMSPLRVGTRIRSGDSLQENRSNFYTEILRIRQVFDAAGNAPLLFLFDELLEGTNSHDRRIGAEGLLRALLGRETIGMVTTHDLALTEVAAALGSTVRNAHFEDSVVDGKMKFDYRLREGVVARSNALELMRLIGLDV